MSTDEGINPRLAGIGFDSSFLERCGRLVVVDGREGWQTVDEGDSGQHFMRDREEPGRDSTVEGREGKSFIRSCTSRETTGGGGRGSRVADDGMTDVLGS